VTDGNAFSVHDGQLRIESDDPPFVWEGLPDGMPVLDIMAGGDPLAAIVLLDPPAGSEPIRNLVKIGVDASVIWRGELPTSESNDCFVSVAAEESGLVVASTWSGYRVHLSTETGKLVRREFTK
jgi:hypothetical protein